MSDLDQRAAGTPSTEVDRLREELDLMKTAGIIEVAVRNPNISDYIEHWEGRAEKAEAELALLRAKVEAGDKLAEAARASRAVASEAMMALMGRGRDELLLADAIHKADAKVRAALSAYGGEK